MDFDDPRRNQFTCSRLISVANRVTENLNPGMKPVHLISSFVMISPNGQPLAKTYKKMVPLSPIPCL
jgi:hypothetical protein